MQTLLRFLRREEAATAVEYSVMVALIIIVCIGAVSQLGGENGALWGQSNSTFGNYLPGSGVGS